MFFQYGIFYLLVTEISSGILITLWFILQTKLSYWMAQTNIYSIRKLFVKLNYSS